MGKIVIGSMLLDDRFRRQGELLFRWRSYLPFILLPGAVVAILDSACSERWFGTTAEEWWDIAAVAVSLIGVAVRVGTVAFVPAGTSGRNTSEQRAETLNTTGIYSIVRNPLYLGNYLILLGFALATFSWWFVLLATLAFALYYERIIHAEESFLRGRFGTSYEAWAARTPAILPSLRLWVRPSMSFSLRSVIRREYNGILLVVAVFVMLDLTGDILAKGESISEWFHEEPGWLIALAVTVVAYSVVRVLKRHSRLLRVDGR
jgi:protein-S-isoprenylcysteine O-methyltransferase Ste14